jgi:hypothetical protein
VPFRPHSLLKFITIVAARNRAYGDPEGMAEPTNSSPSSKLRSLPCKKQQPLKPFWQLKLLLRRPSWQPEQQPQKPSWWLKLLPLQPPLPPLPFSWLPPGRASPCCLHSCSHLGQHGGFLVPH